MTAPIIFIGPDSKLLTSGDLKDAANTIYPKTAEKNYCTRPSSYVASTTLGWNVSAGTASTITSSLPRGVTSKQAIQYVSASSGDYLRYRFQIDDADKSKKLKAQFSQIVAAAGDFNIEVWYGTDSALTGATQLSLSTDSSAVSALAAVTNDYRTTFDTNSNTFYEVRWKATGSSKTLKISDVIIGTGIAIQGTAVDGGTSYTPTLTGFGTVSTFPAPFKAYRVGSRIRVTGQLVVGTPAASLASISLPSSLTHSSPATGTQSVVVGEWVSELATAGNSKRGVILAEANTSKLLLYFGTSDYTPAINSYTKQNGNQFTSAGNLLTITFDLEIDQYSGTGLNISQNDTLFCYNSGSTTTAGASDTTSFGYGPTGTPILSVNSASTSGNQETKFRCRSLTPLLAAPIVEVDCGTSGAQWVQIGQNGSALPSQGQSGYQYGVSVTVVNATDFDVGFGNSGRLLGATYASAGSAWSGLSTWRWRARVSSPGQAIGFGEVQPGISAGLVSAFGLKGTGSSASIAAGYVGEIKTNSATAVSISTTASNLSGSVTLTPGLWLILATGVADGTTGGTYIKIGISTSTSSFTGTLGLDTGYVPVTSAVSGFGSGTFYKVVSVAAASTASYCLTAQYDSGTHNADGSITAIRIA